MQCENKPNKMRCNSAEVQALCEVFCSQIVTTKQRFHQYLQTECPQSKVCIRRDQYLNQPSSIDISSRQSSHQIKQYRSKIEKNQKLNRKYGKNSRLSKIMSTKVGFANCPKSKHKHTQKQIQQGQQVHFSKKSLTSKRKQSVSSRFQKIMNIKVTKPSVCSTLLNYQTSKALTKLDASIQLLKRTDAAIEDKQNKKPDKDRGQLNKNDRSGKHSERKTQLSLKQSQQVQEKRHKQERRKEIMFENLLSKQIIKIQHQREVNKRKTQGFSKYLYPYY